MIEDELKKIIIDKYGSVRQFAQKIDIPYTTLDTILKRGIDNSNVVNIIKICKELKISSDKLVDKHQIFSILDLENTINELDSTYKPDNKTIFNKNGVKVIVAHNGQINDKMLLEINNNLLQEKILKEELNENDARNAKK